MHFQNFRRVLKFCVKRIIMIKTTIRLTILLHLFFFSRQPFCPYHESRTGSVVVRRLQLVEYTTVFVRCFVTFTLLMFTLFFLPRYDLSFNFGDCTHIWLLFFSRCYLHSCPQIWFLKPSWWRRTKDIYWPSEDMQLFSVKYRRSALPTLTENWVNLDMSACPVKSGAWRTICRIPKLGKC